MKRFASMSTLLLALALSTMLSAQEPAGAPAAPSVSTAPAVASIVTVSFKTAVLQTAEAQRELGALQTKYTPRQAQLKTLSDQVGELQKQLQVAADKLSDAERASREQQLSIKEKQLQRDSDDFNSDSQNDSQQVFQAVAQKLFAFMQTYAHQHSYSLVVERGSDAAPVVWYAAGNMDITDALVKAYNAQSGATAPTGRPGAAALPSAPKPQPTAPAPK